MGNGEWGVGSGEYRIIDFDFIIPIQPETILLLIVYEKLGDAWLYFTDISDLATWR
ncbi:hypothetical protein [Microcoleus sp. OTE_8_concoct_300]|uniref:hypothetical protein n=1 Tax=Microcoleus sp. OTE_8_concoct_300 TaxID=2964710 RepID=UPI00403F00BB